MKKSKFSEEQIIGILRKAEGDTAVPVVCARYNVILQVALQIRRPGGQ